MRIATQVRRLDREGPLTRESYGTVRDPSARGRAQFERTIVRCAHRDVEVSAGECLACERFAGMQVEADASVVISCKLGAGGCIEEMMTPASGFAAVSPYTRVADADGYAAWLGLTKLLVARDDDLVGVVCRCKLADRPDTEVVADRMVTEILTVNAAATIAEAREILLDAQSGLVCVVADGEVVGLVSATDLADPEAARESSCCPGCGC